MDILNTSMVAKELRVSIRRVQAMINAGRLPARKIGSYWMIDPKDLAKVRDRKNGRPRQIA